MTNHTRIQTEKPADRHARKTRQVSMPADRHARQADRRAYKRQERQKYHTRRETDKRDTQRERNMVLLRLYFRDVANSSASVNARARLCLSYLLILMPPPIWLCCRTLPYRARTRITGENISSAPFAQHHPSPSPPLSPAPPPLPSPLPCPLPPSLFTPFSGAGARRCSATWSAWRSRRR